MIVSSPGSPSLMDHMYFLCAQYNTYPTHAYPYKVNNLYGCKRESLEVRIHVYMYSMYNVVICMCSTMVYEL